MNKEEQWSIIEKYLKQYDNKNDYNKFLVQHHIKSYETFIDKLYYNPQILFSFYKDYYF